MNSVKYINLIQKFIFGCVIALLPLRPIVAGDSHGHSHGHSHEEQTPQKGLHRGRLLEHGGFSIEITIFERDVPPEFRLYARNNGVEVRPEEVDVQITLERLGGVVDQISFRPEGDYLKGTAEIYEPHSFDVSVVANFQGQKYQWKYSTYEGRTEISEQAQRESGIKTESIGPASIPSALTLPGKVYASEHKIAHIIPRFPGMVREGRKHIGDRVEKGEVLAIIESNQSLQPYEVKSQIAGTIVAGHLIVGEYVPENQWVFIVADLSEVWVDFFAPERDAAKVSKGSVVEIVAGDGSTVAGEVIYVTPFADEKTQTQVVRANVPNSKQALKPGTFVTGRVTFSEHKVALAVRTAAIQSFRDWQVVFLKDRNTLFEARPLELGASGGEWTEVLSGLRSGDSYVTEKSYLIKADVMKSGASHDH